MNNEPTPDQQPDASILRKISGGFIYNVTVKVSAGIADGWLRWMLDEHMPALIATGCFTEYRLLRLLDMEDEAEGPTYAAQYYYNTPDDYATYIRDYATAMRDAGRDKWGDGFHAFRTTMEVVA